MNIRNKFFYVFLLICIILGVIFINRPHEKTSYEKLLAYELTELRSFCGVKEASQVPDYADRDAEDFNIYCTEVQDFSRWGARDTDAHFRFVTKKDGELYLGYVTCTKG